MVSSFSKTILKKELSIQIKLKSDAKRKIKKYPKMPEEYKIEFEELIKSCSSNIEDLKIGIEKLSY